MANKRMFSKDVISNDNFVEMPDSSQNLYFHLSINADDDGFISNYKSIMRMLGKKEDDLKVLIAKSFIIPFENGLLVIRHWRLNNYIQKDRYKETIYKNEKAQLSLDNNNVYNLDTECIHSIDKNSIDKISIDIYAQMFEKFYQSYPKKRAKVKTEEWFKKKKPSEELFKRIMEALEKHKKSKEWKDTQFIPYPSTWLNQKRWEDEIEVDKPKKEPEWFGKEIEEEKLTKQEQEEIEQMLKAFS